ncbi:MAG: hypothetical protein EOO88_48290, partial [Pedobacter sp.]
MQTDDVQTSLTYQIKEFLTYTTDTDNDTIMAQYTLIEGLVNQIADSDNLEIVSYKSGIEKYTNADYDYFLKVNTVTAQP